MTEKEEILSRARSETFRRNNGKVMRVFNVLEGQFIPLTSAQDAAVTWQLGEDEFMRSLNFLVEAGYIKLRTVRGHTPVEELSDTRWELLEGKFTAAGIRLAECDIQDSLVVM